MTRLTESAAGVFVIAATPFLPNGALDDASLDRMTDFYLSAGATGLTILGMMGEAPKLTAAESQAVIARVLAQETQVILLDEPTANLDIGRQVEILDLIKQLSREKNLTVLAALHDLNLAAQYCNHLLLLNNGKVHAEGTPAEVITA